ncbi:oligosaccharide flippase family protein [Candidatus Kaiserbacteria bacterium]|nr:oligosaccharide flippase family protein [Candidatus Kaiserbacteria bacterium]
MIFRAARFLGREIDGLHAAAYVLGVSAFTSSMLALFRDRLFANAFGAGETLDVYYAAFRIPDLIFVLIASLFSAYALIPMLSREDESGRWRYIDTVVFGFGGVMIAISAVAYILMPYIMPVLFPKLVVSNSAPDLVLLSRILLIQPMLLGFSNILAAITQTYRQYLLYAVAPVLYNIGIIFGLVLLYPMMGVTGLVWGVVFGALLHALIQLPGTMTHGFFIRMPRMGDASKLWETLTLSLPRTLALGMTQIVQSGTIIIAGLLNSGSIAVFTFAFNLQAVPLAVIGASYSVAAFPTLTKMISEGNTELFVKQVVTASRHILFWSMPAVALMIVLRAHIVRVILGSGRFDWTDTRLTAASFAFLSLSLAASALTLLIIRAYYAAGRSYLPLAVSLVSGGGTLGLIVILLYTQPPAVLLFIESLLRVEDVPGTTMLLLPFVSSLSAIGGCIAFVCLFERHFGGFVKGIARIFWESLTAAGIGGMAAYAVLAYLGGIGPATTTFATIMHGMAGGLAGVFATGMVYGFFRSPELVETVITLTRKVKIIAPVQSTEESITT